MHNCIQIITCMYAQSSFNFKLLCGAGKWVGISYYSGKTSWCQDYVSMWHTSQARTYMLPTTVLIMHSGTALVSCTGIVLGGILVRISFEVHTNSHKHYCLMHCSA